MRVFLGAILFVLWTVAPFAFAINWWSDSSYIEMLERVQRHDHQQAEYWFKGANERGLVDICRDANGEVKVLWKEDCR